MYEFSEQVIKHKVMKFLHSGSYETAIEFLDEHLSTLSSIDNFARSIIHSLKCHVYLAQDIVDKAKKCLEEATTEDPKPSQFHISRTRLALKTQNFGLAKAILSQDLIGEEDTTEYKLLYGIILRVAGEFDQAVNIFEQVLEDPIFKCEALINLGLANVSLGKSKLAIHHIEEAFNLQNHIKPLWALLIKLKIDTNDYIGALKIANTAVQIDPHNISLKRTQADLMLQLGELSTAKHIYLEILKTDEIQDKVYFQLGNIATQEKDISQAKEFYKKALNINPKFDLAYNNLGNVYKEIGERDKAIMCFDKAIEINSDLAQALFNKANIHYELGNITTAISLCEELLGKDSTHPDACMLLAACKIANEDFHEAINLCKATLAQSFNNFSAFNNLGLAHQKLGNLRQAELNFKQAAKIDPSSPIPILNLGSLHRNFGMKEEAEISYRKALCLYPEHAEAYRLLGLVSDFTDEQIATLTAIASKKSNFGIDDKMHACFALARFYDSKKEHSKAFDFFSAGNNTKKKILNYDIQNDLNLFSALKKTFLNPLKIDTSTNSTSKTPIFIVGLPRSGTSLLEQLLSNHTEIFGAGELNAFEIAIKERFSANNGLNLKDLELIREKYLSSVMQYTFNEPYFTDKLPLNFRWIGFICSIFKDVRIININRKKQANCWSIYENYFSSTGNKFAYDLNDILTYHAEYQVLMDYWRERYSNNILTVQYEELVENVETKVSEILDFLGLPVQPKCFDNTKNKRLVSTASTDQVRRSVYKNGNDKCKYYEKYLPPQWNS